MEYSGHDIADTVRNVYLNRAGINDTAMLPVINAVYEELQHLLIEHNCPIFKTTFSPITVEAGAIAIAYGTGAGTLPSNFISPLKLRERPVGGDVTSWIPMTEVQNLPLINPVETLGVWSWNEESIGLVGASSDREVLIDGYKLLELLAEASDKIKISFAKGYMAVKVAAQCALSISHNPSLAAQLEAKAAVVLSSMISRYVKKDQSFPVRRRAYRRPLRRM